MFLLVLFQRDKFSKRSILGVNEFKINYWAWSQIIKKYSMRYSFYQMQIHTVTYCMLHTVPYYFEKSSSGVKSRQYCEIESKISMSPIMETFWYFLYSFTSQRLVKQHFWAVNNVFVTFFWIKNSFSNLWDTIDF